MTEGLFVELALAASDNFKLFRKLEVDVGGTGSSDDW